MNPYDILGVGKDATPEEIKASYKRKAKVLHPDKGGPPEAFKELNDAYEILSDPERRKKFDETGDTEAPALDPDVKAWEIVTMLLESVIMDEMNRTDLDVIAAMKAGIDVKLNSFDIQITGANRVVNRIETMIRRFKYKGKGFDQLGGMLNFRLGMARRQVVALQADRADNERAKALIGNYDYEKPAMSDWFQGAIAPPKFNSSTAAGY